MTGGGADASLLRDDTILRPGDAAAAILLDPDGRYVLQLRDRKRGIFFPDHWGCFGGSTDATDGDDAITLRRELAEELGFEVASSVLLYFTRYTFDMAFCGGGVIYRTFYEVKLTRQQIDTIQLGEGQRFDVFDGWDALTWLRLTPYDSFAIWMHVSRSRLTGAP